MKKIFILLICGITTISCSSIKKPVRKPVYNWSKDTLTKKSWNGKLSNFIDSFNTSYLKNNQ